MTAHMFPPRGILVATDLSETSAAALRFARAMHVQFGGSLRVLRVMQWAEAPLLIVPKSLAR